MINYRIAKCCGNCKFMVIEGYGKCAEDYVEYYRCSLVQENTSLDHEQLGVCDKFKLGKPEYRGDGNASIT